jgi:SAM-dependent methyltransferase
MKKSQILDYWKNRAENQKERTVGWNGISIEKQDITYQQRKDFIFKFCPRNLKTLDYGCGIGRYAMEFNEYLGVDITHQLLKIAKKRNPTKTFQQLNELNLTGINFIPELFFTATVLQHNPDDVVEGIFKSLSLIKSENMMLCLYENSSDKNIHMHPRSSSDYIDIVSKFFTIKNSKGDKHTLHKTSVHDITIIEV